MEEIFTEEKDFHETIIELDDTKKQFRKAFLGNAGIIVGVFLAFVAAVTTLTDIKITSFGDVANLGMRYFILLFVTYQMYVNTADSGSRRGLLTDVYRDCQAKYNELKGKIISVGVQNLLPNFCTEYIKRELENTRTVIVATIGMSHADLEPYLTKSEKEIDEDNSLSKVQKKIIKKAVKVKPIKLTPDMIMQQGSHGKRSPLGITPKQKKQIAFGGKLVTTAITAGFVVSLAFEVILNPTPSNVMYMLVSCVPIVLNGFTGYKFGYENIVFDTVNYTDAQSSVIEEFLQEVGYGNKVECSDEKGA
jgi:hypothetical protein